MDKRTKEYKETKMLDNNKVVLQCVYCDRKFIGHKENIPGQCPACNNTNCMVINNTLVVNK